jgi:hypothetical protein
MMMGMVFFLVDHVVVVVVVVAVVDQVDKYHLTLADLVHRYHLVIFRDRIKLPYIPFSFQKQNPFVNIGIFQDLGV